MSKELWINHSSHLLSVVLWYIHSWTVPCCLLVSLGRLLLVDRWCSGGRCTGFMTFTVLLPLSGWGWSWRRASRARPLLWGHSGWLATHVSERTMPPLTVRLKCLGLYHLPTVVAHHQTDLIMCWAVAIYVHICIWNRVKVIHIT